jgi:orotidine-5'-phosphate decarboxylase
MKLNWQKLIVALDIENKKEITAIIKALSPYGAKFKIGYIPFIKFGPEFIKKLIAGGADVFIDLKLHDIPNTTRRAAALITELKAWSFTVHACAGEEVLKAVRSEVNLTAKKNKIKKPLILGVTVLTSEITTAEKVLARAVLAFDCGLDGVIASAKEAKLIKEALPKLKVITPGIRLPEGNTGDQKRVMTAQAAFSAGADYIVVGRPILENVDYLANAKKILSC